jgi:hypothetical protein
MTGIMISLIMCIIYMEFMQYKKAKNNKELKKYDLSTCTTADYSVRLNIPPEFYDSWIEYQKKTKDKKDMKKFLKLKIEEDLSGLMPAFTEDEFELKVACIKIARANGALIKLLQERGTCLTSAPEELPTKEA